MPVDLTDSLNIETIALAPAHILANRYQLLSRVVEGLAHEVKNPIHAAVINLELLRRRSDQPETVLARTELLEADITRIHDIVDALFRFLRPQQDDAEWIDIDDAIGAIMPLIYAYCRVARVTISLSSNGSALSNIRKADLQQIILNLIIHTVDELQPAGGNIDLEVSRVGQEIHILIRGMARNRTALANAGMDGSSESTRTEQIDPGLAASRVLAKQTGGNILIQQPDGDASSSILIQLERARPGA